MEEVVLTVDERVLAGRYLIEYKLRGRITREMLQHNPFSRYPGAERLLREAMEMKNLNVLFEAVS